MFHPALATAAIAFLLLPGFGSGAMELQPGIQEPAPEQGRPPREPGRGPGQGRRGRGPTRSEVKLLELFDADKSGVLEREERDKARAHLETLREGQEGRGRRGPPGRGRGRRGGRELPPPTAGPEIAPSDVAPSDAALFDDSTLRTLFLDFGHADWEQELSAFYRTDVDVPARLTADGKTYDNVGVHFRGSSSFFSVPPGFKHSMNLSMDLVNPRQRLRGYRTLNLLNVHADPSFLRTVLFDRVARSYLPALKASFVKVVINGESWGIYVAEQQFNRRFCAEWFGESGGRRWKIPPDFSGTGALAYRGDERQSYEQSYQLKSKDEPEAWTSLIALSKALAEWSDEELESRLDSVLNVDRTLWFLALDNVFIDGDGYVSRGSDYLLYQDRRHGRFHPIFYDSNETFRHAGGGGPGFGSEAQGVELAPTAYTGDERRVLVARLLSIPSLRARYLAHVRTIVREWLDWETIGPIVEQYRGLIAVEVAADTRKLSSLEDFQTSVTGREQDGPRAVPGLEPFVRERRAYLLEHADLARPAPVFDALSASVAADTLTVEAILRPEPAVEHVFLHAATSRNAPFERIAMRAKPGSSTFSAKLSGLLPGTRVRYYVEARTGGEQMVCTFRPARTELGARSAFIASRLPTSAVVVNELLPWNTRSGPDPQGEFEDWIEFHNRGEDTFDLSGLYLTDDPEKPTKWTFPEGASIESGAYLIVFADGDEEQSGGLHAGFKLARRGESVLLVDRDGETVLDWLALDECTTDQSYGRAPDGTALTRVLDPTPGGPNRASTVEQPFDF